MGTVCGREELQGREGRRRATGGRGLLFCMAELQKNKKIRQVMMLMVMKIINVTKQDRI